MGDLLLGLIAAVLATVVAVAFAWLAGKALDWFRRMSRG